MTMELLQNGSGIAVEDHRTSDSTTFSGPPASAADLLAIWQQNPLREAAMLRTTCARLVDYHGLPVNELMIDAVEQRRKGFRSFLETRKYSENSIRTYINHVHIFLDQAARLGWKPVPASSPEWERVIALAEEQGCSEVARHLMASKNHPREVTSEDVDDWVLGTVGRRGRRSAYSQRKSFWRILRDAGYLTKPPRCLLREQEYGIPLEKFPPALKLEVSELLRWKQAKFAWDRDCDPIRASTAKRLRTVVSGLYGYAINIASETGISSLSDLAQLHTVGGFVQWCMESREVKGDTLKHNLRLVDAALRQHPRYAKLDTTWFPKLLDRIPVEPKAVLQKRRAARVLDYATIEQIPDKIRAQRAQAARKGHKKVALLVRDELMIRWLTILPWRQRNLRECRISGPAPNLFKGPVPAITTIDMPRWALEERKRNPYAEFWQFHFTEEETKTGCTVDALVPRRLVEHLEEYLSKHRPHLIQSTDPGTLFLNQAGNPMKQGQVTDVVALNTLRFGGRRVTPHPFRDIVSIAWLKSHPQDYLTLSKMLWHASPNEVIDTYGSLFNESSGVCSMEAWLDERSGKTGG